MTRAAIPWDQLQRLSPDLVRFLADGRAAAPMISPGQLVQMVQILDSYGADDFRAALRDPNVNALFCEFRQRIRLQVPGGHRYDLMAVARLWAVTHMTEAVAMHFAERRETDGSWQASVAAAADAGLL